MAEKDKMEEDRNRRCGFSRRSFTYAHHIPERRKGDDRRTSQECDLEMDAEQSDDSSSMGRDGE